MLRLLLAAAFISGTLGSPMQTDTPPTWSPTYSVKGILMIPYAELQEPFAAWFDSPNDKSRIDYYGGMVKTYLMGGKGYPPFGAAIKIAPMTTEKVTNQMTCFQFNGTNDSPAGVQPVLPDLKEFKFVGVETIRDAETQKWRFTNTIGDKVNKYTMWVKFRKNLDGDSVPIPVRYEMRGMNSLLGSHYDHYYMEYEQYDTMDIDPSVFAVPDDMKCGYFPGPGARGTHLATLNPMKEFVHPARDSHVDSEFRRFVRKHGKTYAGVKEHTRRLDMFRQNLRFIHSTNRAGYGFTVSVNHLADRTPDEIAVLRGRRYSTRDNGAEPFPYSSGDVRALADKLPSEFDWRILGAVTPVKDQSVCGSCWSFGTVGAMEGALFLHNGGHLVRLSQQALVDCSWGEGNNGCDGGEDFRAYQWIKRHGLPTEEDYGGYLGQDGFCHIDNVTLVTSLTSFVNVTSGNENALKLALFKHGPISVAIDASRRTFSFYSNGVYYDPNCKNGLEQLDHAVLAVGYGILKGHKYWLVKNSWSNLWGNDGYILMSARDNNCGVMTAPTYVNI